MKIFQNQNLKQKILALFLGIFLAVGVSYVSAMTRPGDINTNSPEVLHTGKTPTDPQNKDGLLGVKSFIAGSYANPPIYNMASFDQYGALAIGKLIDSASGIALDIKGTDGIKGSIKIKDLAGASARTICADSNGKILICTGGTGGSNGMVQFFNDTTVDKLEYFVVPDGVTSLSVTVHGAGGAGFGDQNLTSGLDDGGSSFFKGVNSSNSPVEVVAYGGRGVFSLDSPYPIKAPFSTLGVTILSGDSKLGEIGGSPNLITDIDPIVLPNSATEVCNGSTYYIVLGGNGRSGGTGGEAFGGNKTNGGSGGSRTPIFNLTNTIGFATGSPSKPNCTYKDKTSDDYINTGAEYFYRKGGDGINGAYGAGGSGFGGTGGATGILLNTYSCQICKGGDGSAGGGSGAYVKASNISVIPGQVFFIKTGGKGVPQDSCISYNFVTCNNKTGGGAMSGSGGGGYVIINY